MPKHSLIGSATLAAAAMIATIMAAPGYAADDEAAKVAADTVRSQGFSCTEAVSAERDAKASKPDEEAWVLVCANARYRVRFMGDMPAKVEPLP